MNAKHVAGQPNHFTVSQTRRRNLRRDEKDWIVVIRATRELNPTRGKIIGRGMSYEMAMETKELVAKEMPEMSVWAMHREDF